MTTTTNGSTLDHPIGETGRFHVRQLSGSIRVRGVDGDTVKVRERSGRNLADAFQVEQGPGSLSLTAPDRFGDLIFGGGRRSSMDLEVEVPKRANVTIETASAELDAADLTAATNIRTASGDVLLTGLAGTLDLNGVSGDVKVQADGRLNLRGRVISGDLDVRAPSLGMASIETTSGDVRLDAVLSGPGPFAVETVSGDVTIVGRVGLRIEARTITGDLRSELPHRRDSSPGRKALIVGDGGTPVTFKSVSGDLRVTAPRDPLPVEVPHVPMPPEPPLPPIAPEAPEAPEASRTRAADLADEAAERAEGGREVARLDILRALERGDMSVEAAMARLAQIEES
jgi:hypothetical protein